MQDMNAQLGKIKQKSLIKFAEAISSRIKILNGEDDEESKSSYPCCTIIKPDFRYFLENRLPILRLHAEISSVQTNNKTLQQEL